MAHVPNRLIAAASNGGAAVARGEIVAFTAKKIGIPPAVVLNSSRKWDRHGDWHMFPDVLRAAFYLLFARRKLKDYARRYWFDDRT